HFDDHAKNFLRFCREHNAPLDFYSYHNYTDDPFGYITQSPLSVRNFLDSLGYNKTELHLNEWHYRVPSEMDDRTEDGVELAFKGINPAVAATLIMTLWQDTPLDKAAYYTVTTTRWGIFRHKSNQKTKVYFAFKAFGELVKYPIRLRAESSRREVGVLSGCNSNGDKAALLSCFRVGAGTLEINGITSVKQIYLLDDIHDLEPIAFQYSDGRLTLSMSSSSAIYLMIYQ
ncbi:MAG: hypothetical protein ACI4UV_03355, partial [Victivallales bacterium]